MPAKNCPKCGEVSHKDALYCTNCGFKLKELPKEKDNSAKQNSAAHKIAHEKAIEDARIEGIRKAIGFFNISVDYCDELNDSEIPLIQAVMDNDQEMLFALLKEGAYVDETDEDDNTALMIAAEKGYKPLVELLLAHNADIDMENSYEENAITLARDNGKRTIVALFNQQSRRERRGMLLSKGGCSRL